MRFKKNLTNLIDPIILIGLFVSVGISIFMVLMGNDSVTSLIIGLLSTIVTLLIDIVSRIQKAESTLLAANDLAKLFSKSKVSSDIRELAHNYDLIGMHRFEHYYKIANAQIIECKMRIRELASGNIYVQAKSLEEYSAYMAFTDAQTSVKAVDFGEPRFWLSESGQKYLKINQEAVKRRVKVTRIFAIDEKQENSKKILKDQMTAGIQTLTIIPERAKQEFMIIDNHIRIDVVFDSNGKYIGERIILDSAQVAEALERFDLLESFSKAVSEIQE